MIRSMEKSGAQVPHHRLPHVCNSGKFRQRPIPMSWTKYAECKKHTAVEERPSWWSEKDKSGFLLLRWCVLLKDLCVSLFQSTQRIHVWYIYHYLPTFTIKSTSLARGSYGLCINVSHHIRTLGQVHVLFCLELSELFLLQWFRWFFFTSSFEMVGFIFTGQGRVVSLTYVYPWYLAGVLGWDSWGL